MIDFKRVSNEMQDMTLLQVCAFMYDFTKEFRVIQKNTFVDRLKNYFLDNPTVQAVHVVGCAGCSADGSHYEVSVTIEDTIDNEEIDESIALLEDIDTDIFEIYEGMENESVVLEYRRDFKGFDDNTKVDDDEEEDEVQE